MKIVKFRVNEYICELLYQGSKHSTVAHFLGISTILFIFKPLISPLVLFFIVFFFLIAIIARSISLWFYFRRVKSTQNIKFWYLVYLFGLLSSSLVWAIMIALLFPKQSPSYQLLIITVAMGFIAGAIMTMSADKLMVLVFTQPIVFSVILQLYYSNDSIYQITAGLLIFLNMPIITSVLTSSEESFRLYQSALLDRQMNAEKTDFLAKMIHELRTPMNAVIGIGYLLEKTDLSTSQQAYLLKLQHASNSLLGIINSILDFSRIEAGQMALENIPFDLRDVMKTVSTHVETQVKQKSLHFDVKIDENITHYLIGDPLRLTQVLTNLTANAVKFTQQGHVKIHVSQKEQDKNATQLLFKVIDTGIGIQEDDKKKLFVSFSQVNSSDSREYGGTGLGLSICKNLLRLMGSDIDVDSVFGTGSTFSFSVDFEKASKACIEAYLSSQEDLSSALNLIPELQGKQVLLVDDDHLNKMVAAEIFNSFGLNVSVANDANAAFLRLNKGLVDVIFMDINMPKMTGYEALAVIRDNPDWYDIPVIALTANASNIEKKKALDHGMDDFLTKPINPSQLRQALLKWIPHEEITIQTEDEVNLLEVIEETLDSETEIEEKLKSMQVMLGREFSKKLFKSVDRVIIQERPVLIHSLQQQKMKETFDIAHRLKGSLSLYNSRTLDRLLCKIEEKQIKTRQVDSICLELQMEFNFIQSAIKHAL